MKSFKQLAEKRFPHIPLDPKRHKNIKSLFIPGEYFKKHKEYILDVLSTYPHDFDSETDKGVHFKVNGNFIDGIKNALAKKRIMAEATDPCWKGYEMVGTKKMNGKEVPNCVPIKEEAPANNISSGAIDKNDTGRYTKKDKRKKDSIEHMFRRAQGKVMRKEEVELEEKWRKVGLSSSGEGASAGRNPTGAGLTQHQKDIIKRREDEREHQQRVKAGGGTQLKLKLERFKSFAESWETLEEAKLSAGDARIVKLIKDADNRQVSPAEANQIRAAMRKLDAKYGKGKWRKLAESISIEEGIKPYVSMVDGEAEVLNSKGKTVKTFTRRKDGADYKQKASDYLHKNFDKLK